MRTITAVRTAIAITVAFALTTPVAAAGPAVAGQPEPGRIVWTNAPDNTFRAGHLVSSRPDGRGLRQLTPDMPGVNDIDASTSPDGERILYERDSADSNGLRIVDADGRRDHGVGLRCSDPCVADVSPTWLVTGRIAFTRVVQPFDAPNESAHSAVLYTANPNGTDVRRLSQPGIDGVFEDGYARITPDRRTVVFVRHRDLDGANALFRMSLDASHVQQLTPFGPAGNFFDISPAQSGPTKDLLVFDTFREGETSLDIATVPTTCRSLADCTSRIRFLTHNAGHARRNGNPTWSPDGQRIAFTDRASIEAVNADIWTMRYDTTDRHRVSISPLFDYRPDWGSSN
jgi:Tol biopolymer transport system component